VQRAATYDHGVLIGVGFCSFVPAREHTFALGKFHDFNGIGSSLHGACLRARATT
jgi:hypothetical protein